jgi:restriction system protein
LDREMHSIYTKNGLTHVRLDINTTKEIDASDYFSMGNALIRLAESYAESIGLTSEESEIDVRQNIQSPGQLELIVQKAAIGAFIAASVGVALFGGHAKSEKLGIDISTTGAVPALTAAYAEHSKQEKMAQILAATLPKMNAEQAEDMMRIVAGQAPVARAATTASSAESAGTAESSTAAIIAEPAATAASSAGAVTAATASLAKPATSSTLADETASTPPPYSTESSKK